VLTERPRGLVLVTGPTGSGKSTTLAPLIDEINREARRAHPHDRGPDRVRAPAQALHRQPARDRVDATSFAEALRAALRQDPDVILLGEMRDLETISTR
jgi:twitching motility protein PilT